MAHRHELSEAEWARLAPLLPVCETRGTYYRDHRLVLNGILFWHATGLPWRDLPERYGPWSTVYSRFRRWTREGVWDRILSALQRGLRRRRVRAVIPERHDQIGRRACHPGRKPAFDSAAYRRRSVVECCVGWLKEARRVATRYEKLAAHYLGVLKLGMIRKHLRRLLPPPTVRAQTPGRSATRR